MNSLDTLYKEIILDHNKSPRNFGPLKDAEISREGFNPLCGDRIRLEVKLGPDRKSIEHCGFTGTGCSICMASASIMTEEMEGASLAKADEAIDHFRALVMGEKDPSVDMSEEVDALSGVRNFPVRIKCALLAWHTLRDALLSREGAGKNVTRTE